MLHCMICIQEWKFLAVHLCKFVQQKVQELGLEQKYEQNHEDKREKQNISEQLLFQSYKIDKIERKLFKKMVGSRVWK